jgi:hypothetical protein
MGLMKALLYGLLATFALNDVSGQELERAVIGRYEAKVDTSDPRIARDGMKMSEIVRRITLEIYKGGTGVILVPELGKHSKKQIHFKWKVNGTRLIFSGSKGWKPSVYNIKENGKKLLPADALEHNVKMWMEKVSSPAG